jgi:hypothetical protein
LPTGGKSQLGQSARVQDKLGALNFQR